jgi:hypothetical protein
VCVTAVASSDRTADGTFHPLACPTIASRAPEAFGPHQDHAQPFDPCLSRLGSVLRTWDLKGTFAEESGIAGILLPSMGLA